MPPPPVKYQQGKENYCASYSWASVLYYFLMFQGTSDSIARCAVKWQVDLSYERMVN